jgi:hypothetical protein
MFVNDHSLSEIGIDVPILSNFGHAKWFFRNRYAVFEPEHFYLHKTSIYYLTFIDKFSLA